MALIIISGILPPVMATIKVCENPVLIGQRSKGCFLGSTLGEYDKKKFEFLQLSTFY